MPSWNILEAAVGREPGTAPPLSVIFAEVSVKERQNGNGSIHDLDWLSKRLFCPVSIVCLA